jgi:PAS domain S-box-containing protein
MTIKGKLIGFVLTFVIMTVVMGGGALYIFLKLSVNIDVIYEEVERHKRHDELILAARDIVMAAEGWARYADPVYQERFTRYLIFFDEISAQLGMVAEGDKGLLREVRNNVAGLREAASQIMRVDDPAVSLEVEQLVQVMKSYEHALISEADVLHRNSLRLTSNLISSSERLKESLSFYLLLIVILGLATTGFLVLAVKRVLQRPYNELFRATEKIASGDLHYRIASRAKDEFGLIFRRFDSMAESLEKTEEDLMRKLKESELFLDVSRMSAMLPNLGEMLRHMCETIAEKMEKDTCGIFLFQPENKAYRLEACNRDQGREDISLPVESEIARLARETLKPFIIDEKGGFRELADVCKDASSLLVVPIVREGACTGILMLGSVRPMGFRADEMGTATILAHTIGTSVKNIELYEESVKQLGQLRTVYELSRALTGVYDPDELLKTITEKMALLINARGCVIRLVDGGVLAIRAFHGPREEYGRVKDVPLGKGIAGWVAKEGKPMFVEDVSQMPEEVKQYKTAALSAISVPLKKDDRIMGTLGLYDKIDERGRIRPFSVDDMAVAEGFASITAIVIEKARMFEEENRTKADLLAATKRMEFLFESVQGGIVTLNRDFTITAANNYVERWVDLPLDHIINQSAVDVFHAKGGICPHCAASVSFEEGSVNSITQSSGLNYADLTSYPVKDEEGNVEEAVVFIQDITERVLYQEEIMGLYREVMQTKEYMEGLINNSADAIVTSDIEGIVRSWNPAAEAIYGFKKEDVLGSFLPFVPENLLEFEKTNIEKIKAGEVLKIETFRKRKDGELIEVSLTLSPIKDVTGDIIGISGISRDISDKKRVEKELIRRNQELSRLFFVSSAMRSTLELDRLLRMVLTAVTMSDGLGFNRAILFLVDEETESLRGTMGVGPSSPEEAWKIWESLSVEHRTLHEIMHAIDEAAQPHETFLDRLCKGIEVPLESDTILARTAREKKAFNIMDASSEPVTDIALIQQLATEAFAAVPLISRDKVIGVMWVDNQFNRKPITEEDMKFLTGFSDQAASAMEAARLFQQISMAEAELENIFRSISDMVFITDPDYTVRTVNESVVNRIGLPKEEIVGRKCYQVFHGMEEPWEACPHHMTVDDMQSHVEEVEDPHLKQTFISSTAPMFDSEGNFQGTVHVVRDISELKDLRVKLQSSERMAALGEVAAKVAHEIRNPLVSVGGFARRLEEKLDGGMREYAHIISEEVRRLESILRDILGFVKEVRMSRKLVNLNEIVVSVLELLHAEFSDKGNTVLEEFSDASLVMNIDPDRVKEAILNIVANANEAMERGRISVRTYSRDGMGVLEVNDKGSGIRAEDLARIFDPFFTTRPTGTGLGLAISKRIVEENDGTIDAESAGEGKGAKFTIILPLEEG